MPIDKGGGGAGDRQPDGWQRIESERAQRNEAQRKRDEFTDPSPEFEKAARPLSEEYGRHRPKNLELTPEQVAEIEEFTGKPIEDVLKNREKDPRAGHNRDELGRILDPHGNPRETPDPYRVESDTQLHRYEPRQPAQPEADETSANESASHGDRAGDRPQSSGFAETGAVLSELANELRTGRLTPDQAAERLDAFRTSTTAATSSSVPADRTTNDMTSERRFGSHSDVHQASAETNARDGAGSGLGGGDDSRGVGSEDADSGDDPDFRLQRRERADRMRDEVDLGAKGNEFPRAGDVLPNVDSPEIPLPKFADYSMRPDHPANREKADGWRALGYEVDDPSARREAAEDVADLLNQELLREGRVARVDKLPDGSKYQVWNGFIGPNGRHATLITGWVVTDQGERSQPKLATAWVQPHKEKE